MKYIQYDIYRYYGTYNESLKQKILRPNGIKYLMVFRKYKNIKSSMLKNIYKYKLIKL